VHIEKASVTHEGGRFDLRLAGFEPLVRPIAEGLLAEAWIEVVASVDICLDGVGERFGLRFRSEGLRPVAALGVAVADFPRVAVSRSRALAFDLSDVRQCSSPTVRGFFVGFILGFLMVKSPRQPLTCAFRVGRQGIEP
jgi:hypothetical protein